MKAAIFHPAVREAIRDLPKSVRQKVGEAVLRLQMGLFLTFPLSRPIRGIAPGVEELRVRDPGGSYRVFYLARLKNRVLVFHLFQKRTRKTPQREIETGRRRLMEMLDA